MEELKYLLLPAESLVVDAAPGWKRVEFTPTQVRAAVEAGAKLAQAKQTVRAQETSCKP